MRICRSYVRRRLVQRFLQGIRELAPGFRAFPALPPCFRVSFRPLVLLLVRPHLPAVSQNPWPRISEEPRRVSFSSFSALSHLPQWMRPPISEEGNSGANGADGGVCPAVSLRRMWLEISPAVDSWELRDAAGGVWEPDDAEAYGTAGNAQRRKGRAEPASRGNELAAFELHLGLNCLF